MKSDSACKISLLVEGYPRYGFDALSMLQESGWEALCITRLHPEYVTQKYGLEGTTCLWLSSRKGAKTLSPKSTAQMVKAIKSALSKKKDMIIFLDGLEYLLMWNDMARVMSALKEIKKLLQNTGCEMLICIDPLTLEQRDLDKLYNCFPAHSANEVVEIMSRLISKPTQKISLNVPEISRQTISDLLKLAESNLTP
jgi:hypothetical protein